VPADLNNDEGLVEFILRVGGKHLHKFLVNRLDRERSQAKVDHPRAHLLHEDEAAEVAVARNEDSPFLLGEGQELDRKSVV
jgi:hypothetical protein